MFSSFVTTISTKTDFAKKSSFQFNKRNYLQTQGTAMGTKMAVALANIFMLEIEKQILNENDRKSLSLLRRQGLAKLSFQLACKQ